MKFIQIRMKNYIRLNLTFRRKNENPNEKVVFKLMSLKYINCSMVLDSLILTVFRNIRSSDFWTR